MRIRAVALAVALASSSTVALAGPIENPILGGTQTTVGQFPTVAYLIVGQGLCTGTLISPNWVLTAGHCVTPSIVGEPSQLWPVVVAVVLTAVSYLITAAANVPLNNAIGAAGEPADASALRARFEVRWVRWNIAPTLASMGAFGALAWALTVS